MEAPTAGMFGSAHCKAIEDPHCRAATREEAGGLSVSPSSVSRGDARKRGRLQGAAMRGGAGDPPTRE